MDKFELIDLKYHPELIPVAAGWFHSKWNIPLEAYLESMEESRKSGQPVPQWYVLRDGEAIIAGLGVIENDFHMRRDLTPNVCAVYVEPEYRCRRLAGMLLNMVAEAFHKQGIDTLYLVTEHTTFYERYGWEFYCMARDEDSEHMTRLYRHIYRK